MAGGKNCSLYCGNLDERVDERILYDILMQAGPITDVYVVKDRETQRSKGYAFVEFHSEQSAQYALKLFPGLVTLFGKTVRFSIATGSRGNSENLAVNGVVSPTPPTFSSPIPTQPVFQSPPQYSPSIMPPGISPENGQILNWQNYVAQPGAYGHYFSPPR